MIKKLKEKMTLKNITRFYLLLGLITFIVYGEYCFFTTDFSGDSIGLLAFIFTIANLGFTFLFSVVFVFHFGTWVLWAATESDKKTYKKYMIENGYWNK